MKTMTQAQQWTALDTYETDLLNETPARRETVTEIQDREAGELICYANPAKAEEIITLAAEITRLKASNAELVEALKAVMKVNRYSSCSLRLATDEQARAAIERATG